MAEELEDSLETIYSRPYRKGQRDQKKKKKILENVLEERNEKMTMSDICGPTLEMRAQKLKFSLCKSATAN